MTRISVDHPGHKDALGRVAFARHVVDVANRLDCEHAGVVIGLQGAWGSGKTQVFRGISFIVEEATADERPILMEFNPWMVSGHAGLVEALLTQMAAEVARSAPTSLPWYRRLVGGRQDTGKAAVLASSLIGYTAILGAVKHLGWASELFVPGSGLVLNAAGHAAETAAKAAEPLKGQFKELAKNPASLSLVGARRQVERALRDGGKKIMVLVDDLDRLAPADLASMFQAIKAVANFPNVIYILAYDPKVAALALQEALSVSDGYAYMEKIVQVQMPVPEAPVVRIHALAIERLTSALPSSDLNAAETQDLALARPLVAAMMRTPRDIERLRTRLLVAVPLLQGEVNIADVILLEALALQAPNLLEWVRHNVRLVTALGLSQYDSDIEARGLLGRPDPVITMSDEVRKQEHAARLAEWMDLLPSDPGMQTPLKRGMGFLFDRLRPSWEGKSDRSQFRRVQQFRFWYQWVCYHTHQTRWTVNDLVQLLTDPAHLHEAGVTTNLDSFIEFCEQLCDIGSDSLGSCDASRAVEIFVEAERELGSQYVVDYGMGFGPVHALISGIRASDVSGRSKALGLLIQNASPWLSGLVLRDALGEVKHDAADEYPEQGQRLVKDRASLEPVLNLWFERVDAWFSQEVLPPTQGRLTLYLLLTLLADLKRPAAEIKRLAEGFAGEDVTRLELLLEGLCDRPEHESFPLEVDWNVLPEHGAMGRLLKGRPSFGQTHKGFMARLNESLRP